MIYRDIQVPIPKKKRIQKKTNYVYEIVERKGSAHAKDKVVCVGVNLDGSNMNPNEKYFDLHEDEQRPVVPLTEPKSFNSSLHIGDYLVFDFIARKEGIYDLLAKYFDKYSEIILAYTYYILGSENSVAQHFKYYLFDNFLGINFIPSESALSQLFNEIIDDESINNFLCGWMNKNLKNNADIIDIDLDSTNFNSSAKNLSLQELGKPKVDENLPQINVAYFLDRTTGLPIYYDVYYGSIVDMAHCQTAITKVHEINKNTKFSFVMDRGYFSSKNLQFIAKNGYFYMCLGKENIKFKSLIERFPVSKISDSRNRIYGNIYGVKLKEKVFENDETESFIYLYYNDGYGLNYVAKLQDEIEKVAKQILYKYDKEGHIRNTYKDRIFIDVDNDNMIVKAEPNYDFINNYKSQLGYFYIVSNEDISINDAIRSYRKRDVIEKSFLMSKSESDLTKKFSQTDTAYKAKTFIGFLCSIFRANLINKLQPYFFEYRSETSQTVIYELNKIVAQKIQDKFLLRYALTKTQKQILSFYKINQSSVLDLIDKMNTILVDC